MGKRFASFYRCLAFARFWKSKILKIIYQMSIFQWRLDGFPQNIYLYIFIFGFFSKTGKTRVSHRVKIMTR